MDEIITTPKPTEPLAPVRGTNDTDAECQKKERDYAPLRMSYDLANIKWSNANKKCVAVIKNTIEPTILGSIGEFDSVTEYLEKINSQFTGSSKTYATQIIEQLVTQRYYGGAGNIRDHIMGMSALNSKLKPVNLHLKEEFLVHLVFAFLPVSIYFISPPHWSRWLSGLWFSGNPIHLTTNEGKINLLPPFSIVVSFELGNFFDAAHQIHSS